VTARAILRPSFFGCRITRQNQVPLQVDTGHLPLYPQPRPSPLHHSVPQPPLSSTTNASRAFTPSSPVLAIESFGYLQELRIQLPKGFGADARADLPGSPSYCSWRRKSHYESPASACCRPKGAASPALPSPAAPRPPALALSPASPQETRLVQAQNYRRPLRGEIFLTKGSLLWTDPFSPVVGQIWKPNSYSESCGG
jgi:hypothetical protein